jgi:hypothetical protein
MGMPEYLQRRTAFNQPVVGRTGGGAVVLQGSGGTAPSAVLKIL